MSIQKRIDTLKPYVIQIRFLEGMTIVDTVFKRGWRVPESKVIQAVKGENTDENYYMFYTEREDLGIDDVLDFIKKVIEINIEREKKFELLKVKTEELKNLFKTNTLDSLQRMRFVLGGSEFIPETMTEDFDEMSMRDIDSDETLSGEAPEVRLDDYQENTTPEVETVETVGVEREPIFEKVGNQEIELPPRGEKIFVEEYAEPNIVCKCGPDDVCPVCIGEEY